MPAASSLTTPTEVFSIPDAFLDRLICCRCKYFLSVPPIYSLPDGKDICGRCINPKNPEGLKNDLYEVILEFAIFPCMNKQFGCLESRSGKNMYEHETKCRYRRVNCPTFSTTTCDWVGEIENLLEHFENKHVTCLLQEPSFEVNFVHNYDEICLLPYADRLFLVRRFGNIELKEFQCCVATIFANENEKFQYVLKLKNPSNGSTVELPQQMAVSLKNSDFVTIKANEIQEKLKNPSTIIASIDIVLIMEETPEKNIKKDVLHSSNAEMLKIIECPVCFEYMVPPIYQCSGGHSICGECKNKMKQCPSCEKPFGDTQNYAVESFTSFLQYPCKNAERGCDFILTAKEIKQHEKLCTFGTFHCPSQSYNSCPWSGVRDDTLSHCEMHHVDNLMQTQLISLPFNESYLKETIEEFFIFKYLGDTFVLHWQYDSQFERFYWALQLFGPPEECVKYYFDLDIIDRSGKNLRIFMRCPCSFYTEKDLAFTPDKSFLMLDYDQVQSFINEVFSFKVSVLKSSAMNESNSK